MAHTLVLNASYEPLAVVSDRRALILVLTHKAILLEDSGQVVHSATRCLALPTRDPPGSLRPGASSRSRPADPPRAVRP